jgi:carbon monoxide dehydrogenase subunit G
MKFNGTFELEDTTVEEVWLALSDPVLIADALPGCEFLRHVESDDVDFDELVGQAADREAELTGDAAVIAGRAFRQDEWYAGLVQVNVGPVNPTFETVVRIDERDQPRMEASGEGTSGNSSFEMSSWMALTPTEDGGVAVDWGTEADVFGKVAGMGQRVINPVANRLVKRFFSGVQSRLRDLQLADTAPDPDEAGDQGIVDRLLGRSNEST